MALINSLVLYSSLLSVIMYASHKISYYRAEMKIAKEKSKNH